MTRAQTVALVREALGPRQLARLLNTHSHSDHISGNAAVQQAFGCRIGVPHGIVDAVKTWDEALLPSTTDQQGEAFHPDHALAPGDRMVMGGFEWQALPAPGHDMDALVFHAPDVRGLISGDALWRNGFGILFADVIGAGGGIEGGGRPSKPSAGCPSTAIRATARPSSESGRGARRRFRPPALL